MPFFSYLYRNGLWIGPLMFLVGAVMLACMIFSLLGVIRRARLLTVPLVPRQEFKFAEAGQVVLCTEGPHLSRRFAGLKYELTEDGRPVEGRRAVFRSRTSGFSSARTEAKVFEIPSPGSYTLLIRGLSPDTQPDQEHRIVFMKPHLGRSILHVLGIIVAAALLIGGIVLFGLRVATPGVGWEAVKVPVILVVALTGFTALVFVLSVFSKKRERAEKQFALAQGWTYSESYADAQGHTRDLAQRLEKVCPEKEFKVGNNMILESDKRTVRLFSCSYRVREWGPKMSEGFGCLVESDRYKSVTAQVDISGKSPVDRLLLKHQVAMGNSEFARNFIVDSKEPATATTVVSDRIKSLLVDGNHENPNFREICIGPGGLVILTKPLESREWMALAKFARKLEGDGD